MSSRVLACLTMALLIAGCQPVAVPAGSADDQPEPDLAVKLPVVLPSLETHTVIDADEPPAGERRGDADDPAIWIHPTDPARSLVIAALKEGGMEVYNLAGEVVQSAEPAGVRYNNVDLVTGFSLGGQTTDLAVFSDRFSDNLAFYAIDRATGLLTNVSDPANPLIYTPAGQPSDETTTAYGLATYRDPVTGNVYAFVSRRDTGDMAQLILSDTGAGQMGYQLVRTFSLPIPDGEEADAAQIEGMVVDPVTGILYLGQENVGVWRMAVDPAQDAAPELFAPVDDVILFADVEGLTLYFGPDREGYLLVSSQGNNSFALYSRLSNDYLGSFIVGDYADVDGAQESDGAMITNVALGAAFPQGLLVVQDGDNQPELLLEDDGEMENVATSFKFVPWEQVANAFNPPLLIDTTPR